MVTTHAEKVELKRIKREKAKAMSTAERAELVEQRRRAGRRKVAVRARPEALDAPPELFRHRFRQRWATYSKSGSHSSERVR